MMKWACWGISSCFAFTSATIRFDPQTSTTTMGILLTYTCTCGFVWILRIPSWMQCAFNKAWIMHEK